MQSAQATIDADTALESGCGQRLASPGFTALGNRSFHSARSFSAHEQLRDDCECGDNTLQGRIRRSRSRHFPLSATLLMMWPYLCIPPLLCVLTLPLEILYYLLSCGCCGRSHPRDDDSQRIPSTPATLSAVSSPTTAPKSPASPPLDYLRPLSALMPECSPVRSS